VFFGTKISGIQLTFHVFHANFFVLKGILDGHVLDVHVALQAICPSFAPWFLVLVVGWYGLVHVGHAEVLQD
jgi:hypothetical protein